MKCRWCGGTGHECGCGEGYCIHCGGSGEVTPPPFGTGSTAKIPEKEMQDLANNPGLRNGPEELVKAVAQRAANIHLSPEDVETFASYWNDTYRDANLGEFIYQVAERAEHLAST